MPLEGREVDRVLGSIGFTWFLSTCSIHNTSKLGCKDIIHQAYVTLGEAAELERVKYNTMVKRVLSLSHLLQSGVFRVHVDRCEPFMPLLIELFQCQEFSSLKHPLDVLIHLVRGL